MPVPTSTVGSKHMNITGQVMLYDGKNWVEISPHTLYDLTIKAPTRQELEEHPSLKNAWEEYLVTRKLLGLE